MSRLKNKYTRKNVFSCEELEPDFVGDDNAKWWLIGEQRFKKEKLPRFSMWKVNCADGDKWFAATDNKLLCLICKDKSLEQLGCIVSAYGILLRRKK